MMSALTENIVLLRSKAQDLCSVKKLNCWGSNLTDVSIVRRLKFVEVLSLSLNSISSLADFAHCPCLKELYLRKNKIENLNEVYYLKDLEHLQSLWLEDNPCAQVQNYRSTVLQILPNLKILDNISVKKEERTLLLEDKLQNEILFSASTKVCNDFTETSATHTNEPDSLQIIKSKLSPDNLMVHKVHSTTLNNDEAPEKNDDIFFETCKNSSPIHPKAFHAKVQTMVDHPMSRTGSISNYAEISDTFLENRPFEKEFVEENICPHFSNFKPFAQIENTIVSDASPINQVHADLKTPLTEEVTSKGPCASSSILQKSWNVVNSNLLSAVLCLIKELDYSSLEIVRRAILSRMDEIE